MTAALTAEEWARWFSLDDEPDQVDTWSQHDVLVQAYNCAEVGGEHGVAATLLYGQPFGFTRKDVRFLRTMVSIYRSAPQLESLADRIEALLPPETA